ncbi:MAG: porin family protein [Melioribacteraceae bacterium]|nr:porin family protein [Melioribacteraceae bacterium]
MKKLFVLLFIASNILYAQTESSPAPFSIKSIGFYGGVNTASEEETGGVFLLDFSANLISNLNLDLSAGYSKIFEKVNYHVKRYYEKKSIFQTLYTTEDFDVTKRRYDVIPLSAGLQYILLNDTFTPYIFANVSYNIILTNKEFIRNKKINSYPTENDVPYEYKVTVKDYNIWYSTSINAGLGVMIELTPNIDLDLRYLYKSDSELIDTHQFLLGIRI